MTGTSFVESQGGASEGAARRTEPLIERVASAAGRT